MTLQQLRYLIKIVQTGSINLAAQELFLAQPSLSKAMSELEKEMGLSIFVRSHRGVTLTEEGSRFLAYARQVVEQADLLEQHYKGGHNVRRVFAISAQHYAFVVNAFVSLVREYGEDEYEFSLRECRTHDIIEDVRTYRSELGVLYLSDFNSAVMRHILQGAELSFQPLFTARPHVFVSRRNPLAGLASVTLDDLAPYPRLTYEQGTNNSFYFAEELHSTEQVPKSIIVSDRATLFNLLIGLDGYTISSGVLSADLNGTDICAVPLESQEHMDIGYIHPAGTELSPLGRRYIELLQAYIQRYGLKLTTS
ncbi:MAG: LysR family transcriptional regulator [Selenomonas sp.]|uniref:LysR family transcriptional regulator n=1 Tax=Selenomonas sp. TaxID=2053611 RepID=UPI0025D9D266|nr:LysR family transcriptional regulator [Selenomonas sp.]MCI6100528.1 LysR family transcriptional regulator [Selenomonas sp.]MCI6231537.1 LysR family transcriptional regulator [Selenomonas sp.]